MMRKVIAAAFKSKGKKKMARSELIYTMSFDLNWFSYEGSKKVVDEAEKEGLIRGGDEISPTFDIESVDVPSDFRPELSKLLSRSTTDKLIEEIADKINRSYQEVVSIVNKKQEKLEGLVSFQTAALIVAKESGVDISKYLQEVEREILNESD